MNEYIQMTLDMLGESTEKPVVINDSGGYRAKTSMKRYQIAFVL